MSVTFRIEIEGESPSDQLVEIVGRFVHDLAGHPDVDVSVATVNGTAVWPKADDGEG